MLVDLLFGDLEGCIGDHSGFDGMCVGREGIGLAGME